MPSGLIEEKGGMRARRDLGRDLGQVEVHGFGVAMWHDKRRALSRLRTYGPKNIGGRGSLIFRRARTRSALGPAARDLVLLADAGFVGAPDFYVGGIDALLATDLLQARWQTFLKSSIALSACA